MRLSNGAATVGKWDIGITVLVHSLVSTYCFVRKIMKDVGKSERGRERERERERGGGGGRQTDRHTNRDRQ